MGKNVAVFVDVANVFYAAKAAGVDIDYVTLLKTVTAGRDLVRAYAYTGLDPDNENQRNFHDFLRRSGYKVVSKDIRKYGDGKVKANLDIELVVDMMKTARNLDIAIVVSGDGDFAPAIRAVQEQGVRVEVLSFRGNTSSDLMDVADLFTDIAQIAKVEKGSSRSGRRVASDEEDLSMTEVPDKLSEGTGRPRGRGRTRTPRAAEGEVVAAPRPRSRSRAVVEDDAVAAVAVGAPNGGALIALPGEKLSKAATARAVVAAPAAVDSDEEPEELLDGEGAVDGEEEPRRRRRRRGGRGRGRGRAHEDGLAEEGTTDPGVQPVGEDADDEDEDVDIDEDAVEAPAPAKRPVHAFGSVWDSQIGVPTAAVGGGTAFDDEDLDEPPIPEYLIAERRQQNGRSGGTAGRGGGRGVRAGYAAAVDRERYGGRSPSPSRSVSGPSSGSSRYGEPAPRGGNREPERFRNDRPPVRPAPRVGNPDEPWSEVSPELEAMLRAQIGSRPRPAAPAAQAPTQQADSAAIEAPAPKRRVTRKPASAATGAVPAAEAEAPAPKRRAPRKAAAVSPTVVDEGLSTEAPPKKRATRKVAVEETSEPVAKAAPKRRTTRKAAEPTD
ncbi:MAG: NYN domain-containing protein [Chloroflexota bacterium]